MQQQQSTPAAGVSFRYTGMVVFWLVHNVVCVRTTSSIRAVYRSECPTLEL